MLRKIILSSALLILSAVCLSAFATANLHASRNLDLEQTKRADQQIANNSLIKSSAAEIDTSVTGNKIRVLNMHIRYWYSDEYTIYNYPLKTLTPEEYQAQKPADNLIFDAGFVDANGIINISEPVTTEQKAVFPDLTKVALYYLCQSYMYQFYGTRNLPLMLKVGFGIYEAGILPPDAEIKTAVNNYGGSLPSFDVLNNPATFVAHKGWMLAGVFGEFMNVYKNWAYQFILQPTATGFNTDPGWFNTNSKEELLADFNRYLYARFLQPDENLRVKMCVETEHFKFYTNQKNANINFPFFSDVLESAYNEYVQKLKVKAYEKLTFFTMVGCEDGDMEGLTCDPNGRLTGGTAWSSGVHSTSSPSKELLQAFYGQNRHELAHTFQCLIKKGRVTAWLMEGFPGILSEPVSSVSKDYAEIIMNNAIKAYGHRPNYENTLDYSNLYDYYTFGYYFNDFLYRKGGYELVKKVQQNDLAAYQSLGYADGNDILDDFYFDYDVRYLLKPMVTLTSPIQNSETASSSVSINWIPLKPDVKLNVSVSMNNGMDWTTISTNTTSTSCIWEAGNFAGNFLLKFTAPDNLGAENVLGPFCKIDLEKPFLKSPNGKEILVAGDTATIEWAQTSISNFKIELSANNGIDWNVEAPMVSTDSKKYSWVVPNIVSNNCKIRISDVNDASRNDISDTSFSIVSSNAVGGPYLTDKNTLVLMHFDNDLRNRSILSGNGVGSSENITTDADLPPQLGNCYKTKSAIAIPHCENLNLSADWTIEAWVKFHSFNNDHMYLFYKPGENDPYLSNYSLEVNPWWNNVFFGFYFADANTRIGLVSQQTINLNEWYHVAMTRDAQKKRIQIFVHDKNRNLLSVSDVAYDSPANFPNHNDLLIGTGIDGYMDEVRISNVVRDFTTTGIETAKTDHLFTVYPNPTKGIVRINLSPDDPETEVRIINIHGETVLNKMIHPAKDMEIDLSSLPKGIYFIQLNNSKGEQSGKIVLK